MLVVLWFILPTLMILGSSHLQSNLKLISISIYTNSHKSHCVMLPLGWRSRNGADYCPVFSFHESPRQNDWITVFLSSPQSFPEMGVHREIGVCHHTVYVSVCSEIRATCNMIYMEYFELFNSSALLSYVSGAKPQQHHGVSFGKCAEVRTQRQQTSESLVFHIQ